MEEDSAELRLRVPFVEKAEIELKKIGLELVVRVGGHKRNIMLPSALASFRPREAKLEERLPARAVRAPGAGPSADRGEPGPRGGVSTVSADDPFAGLGGMPRDPFSSFEDRPPGAPPGDPGSPTGKVEHQCVAFCPICRTADVFCAPRPRPSSRSTGRRSAGGIAGGADADRPLHAPPGVTAHQRGSGGGHPD